MKTNTPLQNLVSRVADRLSPRNDSSAPAEKSPRPLVIEALEPRILFSGSPAPAPEAAPAESPAAQESAEAAPEESAPASEEASVAAPPAASRSGEAASSSEAGSGDTAITLTDTELSALSEAASSIWASSGLTEEQVAALSSASYQISDLGGKILGSAEGNLITIDDDAAGRGWFVDGTPEEDSEFAPGGSATTGIDLLSVLLHEQGHLLGLDDGVAAAGDVMFEAIGLGERRLPDVGEAAGAVAGSLEGVHLITFSGVEDFEGEAGSTFSDPGGTSTFTAGGGLLVSAAGGYGSGASGTFLDIGFGNTVAAPASLGSIAIEAGHSFEVTSLDIALTSDDGTDDPNADTANVDSMLTITGVRFGGGADVVATVTVNSDTAGGYVTLDQAGELAPFAGIQLSSLEFDLPAGSPATFIYIDNFGFTSDDNPGGGGGGGGGGGTSPTTGVSGTAPAVDGADIAELTTPGSHTDKTWSDTANHGQTFTTGANADGYLLNAFTVQTSTNAPGIKTYNFRVGEVSGSNFTTIYTETIQQTEDAVINDYISFAFATPVVLDPNKVYGVDFEMTASTTGWQSGIPYLYYNRTDGYAGGARYTRVDGDPATISITAGWDRVFHIDMEEIASEVTLVDEGFENPSHPNNTANPTFAGWVFAGGNPSGQSVKSRTAAGTSDVPYNVSGSPEEAVSGVDANQLIQFEWTNGSATYDINHDWASGEAFTLTLNASPQSWNGTQDRFIAPSIVQDDGTVLWSANTLMPHYNNFGRNDWTPEQTFEWVVLADNFTAGTEGESISLKIESTGFRGMYFDNVKLTVGAPPSDTDAPTPDPSTWAVAPTVGDYGAITMTASNASDPAGVQYYFENITAGSNSGWQVGSSWTESGLDHDTEYTYRVKTRDGSTEQNEGGWSTEESATTPSVPAGTIIATGFEAPSYPNNTGNPEFAGWTYANGGNVVSRTAAGTSDVPYNVGGSDAETISGVDENQLIQFTWTNATATHEIAAGSWGAGDELTLSLDASPQSWNGASARFIEPSILNGNNVVWSASEEMPIYDNFGRNDFTPDQNFEWTILADDLISGGVTEGGALNLRLAHSGQRGIYIDNVLLTALPVAGPPPSGIDAVDDDYTTSDPTDEDTVLSISAPGVLGNDTGGGGGGGATPTTLAYTDFDTSTIGGSSNIKTNLDWVLDGLDDPGDLAALNAGGSAQAIFDGNAFVQDIFIPGLNTGNGNTFWTTDVPITVAAGSNVTLTDVTFNSVSVNGGQAENVDRENDYTLTLLDPSGGTVEEITVADIDAGTSAGQPLVTIDFTDVALTETGTYTLRIKGGDFTGNNETGNHTGLDNLSINGTVDGGGGASAADIDFDVTAVFDFDSGATDNGDTLDGWSDAVGQSFPANQIFGNSGNFGGRGTGGSANGSGNQDSSHPSLIMRSPTFVLGTGAEIQFSISGGTGSANLPSNVSDVAANSSNAGAQGVGLQRVSDGEYLLTQRKAANGNSYETFTWDSATLDAIAAANPGEEFTVDFFDDYHGGWGFAMVDDVSITTGSGPSNLNIISSDSMSANGAAVTVNADGSFTYDPTASPTLQALNVGDSVTDTFTYTISDAVPAGPASLTAGSDVLVSENNANFNISVFDGKARYDNSGTGAYTNPPLVTTPFGDGTVEDYNFVVSRNGMTDPLSYASGGAGLTPDPYDPNPGTGGYSNNSGQQWANVWTTSDPDTAPKDFVSGAINTTHAGHGEIQGTVDISGLKSGTVYFPHGTFINNWTIQVVMSGGGQPDLTATKTQGGNGPGQNFGWITDFTFDNAEYYDTITYTYTNGDLDGSRARFMGVILDGVPISGTDTATVTVSVNGVNDAPVAVDDHGAVTETADAITDPQATGNVLANDTDVDNVTADFILLEVDGDANNVGNAIAGTYGSVVINSDGSYTYTLDDADPDTQALQEGETVTETFEYTMTDSPSILSTDFSNDSLNGWTVLNGVENFSGNGISASQSGGNFAHDGAHETFLVESPTNFTIGTATVDGTNALSVVFDGGQGSQGGSVAPFANPAAALEFNGGNSATDGLKGLAFLNTATGQYDATVFDPSNGGGNQTVNMTAAQLQSAGVDLNASYRLHYYENDQGSWGWTRLNSVQVANTPVTDTATLTVTVTGANDSPIATDNTAAVTEDNAISDSGNVISDDDGGGADSDVDNATLTVTDVGGTAITTNTVVGGTHGDLTISGDGSYTYDLDNPAAQSLAAGETATDTFTYTVSDMAVGYNPGLVAGTVPGSFNTTDANSGNAGISLDLSEANNGIAGNTTEVYTGQFYDADGVVSFREHIDDATYLMIDGQVVLNNSQWNVETNSGTLNLTPGWVDFELRVGNGGGGNGPVGGIGFEYDPDGGTNWSKIQDGAGSSILRYGVPAPATDTADLTVTVTGVNDAPVLSGANDFDGVVVDDADNDGNAVSELTGTITDVDNGALIGAIAVTGTSVSVPGAAVFQYSHNGGAWTDIGAVDANNGLLLFSTDRIRFSPNGTQQVTGSIDFKAWDQTGATAGLEGTKVDTVPDGGESAFSTAIATSAAYTVNVTIDNGTLQYGEEEGREDKVTIWSDGTSVFIRDANGPITTDDGVQVDPNTVSFMITDFEDILFEANDFDDTITVGDMPGFDGSLTIDGEEGFDTVTFAGGMTLALGTGTQNGTDENLDVDAETVKIDLDASLSVVGGGTIDITATGGGAEDVVGIQLRRAGLSSEDGAITLVGEGGSSGNHNDGVLLSHGSSITTGGGSVSITGTATSAAGPNDGVSLVGGSDITVGGAGTITITGTSNGASDSYGVQLFTGTELTSAEGDISLAGGGNGTGARNSGIYTNGATVTTTGAGSISLDGEGSGGGTNSKGLRLTGSTLEAAGTGGITLTGTGGGGTSSNVGVEVGVRTSVTTASGDVTITGEGAGSATRNAGVSFLSRSSVDSGGGITVTGTGGDGTSHNDGVSLVSATLDAGGDISVTGVGAGSGNYNRGIDSTRSSFGGGEVTLTGTGTQNGGGSARFGDGVYLNRGGATAAGTLTIGATGGTGSSNNRGLYASGVTLGGTLAVTGTADAGTTGSGNSGVYIQNSTLGAGTILGTAGGGTGSFGAHLQNITGGIAPGDVTTGPDDDEEKSGNFFNVLPALVLAAGADRVGRKRREQLAGLIGRLGESAAGEGEMEVYREEDGIIGLEATLATVASLEAAGVEVPAAGGGTRRVLVLTGGGEGQATGVFASVDGAGKLVSTSSLKVRGELTAPELMGSLADGDCEGWSQVPRETTPVAGTSFSEAFGIE